MIPDFSLAPTVFTVGECPTRVGKNPTGNNQYSTPLTPRAEMARLKSVAQSGRLVPVLDRHSAKENGPFGPFRAIR